VTTLSDAIDAFEKGLDEVHNELQDLEVEAWAKLDRRGQPVQELMAGPAWDEYMATVGAAYKKRYAAEKVLCEALQRAAEGSGLASWIVENFALDFANDACAFLRILPATPEEMWAFALERKWCETWEEAYEDAKGAGLVPEAPSGSVAAYRQANSFYWCTTDEGEAWDAAYYNQ
jgi:hypothetical protein